MSNMSDANQPKIKGNLVFSKKDVAERQLNTAIELFFDNQDPISVHTLAAASHNILEVLTRTVRDFEIFQESSCIKPEKKSEVIVLFKRAQNFFKHSDRDASKSIEFVPFLSEMYLFDCVRMYIALTNQTTAETHVFQLWFIMKYPQYFDYHLDPKDPFFQIFSSAYKLGLDPSKNLKSFGEIIPLLRQSGKFPMASPKLAQTEPLPKGTH